MSGRLTTLEDWAAKLFGQHAPSIHTLRRWARDAKILPTPKKHGRTYFVAVHAIYLGDRAQLDSARGRIRRMCCSQPLTYPLDYLRSLDDTSHEGAAVYFLWNGPKLLYVGKTIRLRRRIATHSANRDGRSYGKPVPFNRYTVLKGSDKAIADIERRHIAHYRPPFNQLARQNISK